MTPKRIYFTMLGINTLLILLILVGTFFGAQLIKKQGQKLTTAKIESKSIEEQQISLSQAKSDIEKYKELNDIAKSIVPQDKDQAKTVREINKLAEESGINLKAVSFNSSNLGQVTAPSTAQSKDSTDKNDQNSAQKAAPQPTITQVKPVDGITGVYAMEIIVSSVDQQPVQYDDFITFLEKLENNRRTAHVAKINIKPTADGSALTFSLTLNAYVKP